MLRQGSFRLPHGAGDRRGKGQQFHKVFKPTTTKQGSTLQGQSTEAIANSKAPTMSGPVGEGLDSMDSGLDDIGEVVNDVDDGTESSTADTASVLSRKKGKGRSMPKRAGQPRQVYCHLCGQPTDIKTFRSSHLKVCRRIWREDENSTVKALIDKGLLPHGAKGRPFPPEPMLPLADGDELVAPDETIDDEGLFYINELARHIWKTHAQYQCPHCQRGFNHGSYLHHAKGCHPVQSTVHFGRKDHTFHSVEAAVTKSYKQPHAFHDAPVSRPDGPNAAQLGPDGLPLYLNRENVEAWRGVPSVASLRQQERSQRQSSTRNSTESGLCSSGIGGGGGNGNASLRAMLVAARNGQRSKQRSRSSGPGSSRGSLLGEAFAVGNSDNGTGHRNSSGNAGRIRSKSAGRDGSAGGHHSSSSGTSALAAEVRKNGSGDMTRSFDKTVSFRPLPGGASFDWENDWSFTKATSSGCALSGAAADADTAVGMHSGMHSAAGLGDPQDFSDDSESPPCTSTQQPQLVTEMGAAAAAQAAEDAAVAHLSSSLKPWQPVGKAKPVLTRPGSASTAEIAASLRRRGHSRGASNNKSSNSTSKQTNDGVREESPAEMRRKSGSTRERDAPFAQFVDEVRRRNGHSASRMAITSTLKKYGGSGRFSGNTHSASPPPTLDAEDPIFCLSSARAQARAKSRGPDRQRPWAASSSSASSSRAASEAHTAPARNSTTKSAAPPATKPFLRRSSCVGPLGTSRQTQNSSSSGVDSAAALRQSLADGSLGVQAALEALADAVARLEAPRKPQETRLRASAGSTAENPLAALGLDEWQPWAPEEEEELFEATRRDAIRVHAPSMRSSHAAETSNYGRARSALQPRNENCRASVSDDLPIKQYTSLQPPPLAGPPRRAWSDFEERDDAHFESDHRPPSRLYRKEHRRAFASSLDASMRPTSQHSPIASNNLICTTRSKADPGPNPL